jgi:hypothetical protein
VCVCERERERESENGSVCVCERERESMFPLFVHVVNARDNVNNDSDCESI